MPSPSMHADMTPLPKSPFASHSPTDTLVSNANEADELRRRISAPGGAQEEDLELEEIDLDDSLPMRQALPSEPEPSETVAPAPRQGPAHTAELEIPIELAVPPGVTRLQLRLKLNLSLKR
jgi:hypothetical protein